VLVAVLCCVVGSEAQTCDPVKGVGINPDCDSVETPYCRSDGTVPVAFKCYACATLCDCATDEYCGSFGGDFGVCKEFTEAGADCRPMSSAQLIDARVPKEWKCAAIADNSSTSVNVQFAGVCIEGVCRMCNPRSSAGCAPQSGFQTERTCGYPGHYVGTHSSNWNPGDYYESPVNVWFAIFFCLMVLILVAQFFIAICARKSS